MPYDACTAYAAPKMVATTGITFISAQQTTRNMSPQL